MDLKRVAPDLRRRARWLPRVPLGKPWALWLTRALANALPRTPLGDVSLEQVEHHGLRLRVYRPADRRGDVGMLWIHGGGYVLGSAALDDRICVDTCRSMGIVIVSVDYRLAPEHPYPAPLDDCFAGWAWLLSQAGSLGVNSEQLVIGGRSAGGGLAAALTQRVNDGGGPRPIGQWLFCPMLDDRTAANRDLDLIDHIAWSNRANEVGWRSYLGQPPGTAVVPEYAAAARRRDVTGLPPTWIGIGDIDLFYEESRQYAERLHRAGVPVTFEVIAGAPHGFETWAARSASARALMASAEAWLLAVSQPMSPPNSL